MKNATISILGCGWLGLPLAVSLVKQGYGVKGSTTSADKLSKLAQLKIDPYLVQLTPYYVNTAADGFFETNVLIINIPPQGQPDQYLIKLQEIITQVKKYNVKKVIFVSSTSVYGDCNQIVDELSPTRPDSEAGKVILQVEELLRELNIQVAILRFAGLVGPERHPGRFLAGKKDLPNGKSPVNLIHLDDCIGIIQALLETDNWDDIYIGCAPGHPDRAAFYALAAKVADLPEPHFIEENICWKRVESKFVQQRLNYNYVVNDWIKWLNDFAV